MQPKLLLAHTERSRSVKTKREKALEKFYNAEHPSTSLRTTYYCHAERSRSVKTKREKQLEKFYNTEHPSTSLRTT